MKPCGCSAPFIRRALFGSLLVILVSILGSNAKANVIVVTTTIQAAVNAANPGDTVRVPSRIYHENVLIAKNNITIRGAAGATLDGIATPGSSGITVRSSTSGARINGFVLTGLRIRNYSGNGVILIRVDNFQIDHGEYIRNEEYGIFPILSSHGVVEFNYVSGSNDTGIYIGQSHDALIKDNYVTDCTVGIDVENSSDVVVRDNSAVGNSIGMTTEVLPGLTVTATTGVQITCNLLSFNNRANPVTDPADPLSQLPSGTGLLIAGADDVVATSNIVLFNNSVGIAVTQLPPPLAALDPRIDPFPDNDTIRQNIVRQNGSHPDPKLAPFPPADLIWDFSGTNNCWDDNIYRSSFPAPLPDCH